MTNGEARLIFDDIENPEIQEGKKDEAIRAICGMATHNSVPKSAMLKVIRWMEERRIRKEPYLEGDGYYNGELVFDTWVCPNCGRKYELDEWRDHCPNCGQALKMLEECD